MADTITQICVGGYIAGGTVIDFFTRSYTCNGGLVAGGTMTKHDYYADLTGHVAAEIPAITILADAIYLYGIAEIELPLLQCVVIGDIQDTVGTIVLPRIKVTAIVDYSSLDISGQAAITITPPTITSKAFSAITLPDGTEASGLALVINIENGSLSEYLNFAFNSFAFINGVFVGANDTGLYQLTGEYDQDTEIEARFRLARTNFGFSFLKRPWNAYIAHKSTGEFELILVDAEDNEYGTIVLEKSGYGFKAQRVKLKHNVKSERFGVEYLNTDGADFEVDSVEITAEVTNRR